MIQFRDKIFLVFTAVGLVSAIGIWFHEAFLLSWLAATIAMIGWKK